MTGTSRQPSNVPPGRRNGPLDEGVRHASSFLGSREEQHGNAVALRLRKRKPQLLRLPAEELMGNLGQHARPIPGPGVPTHRSPVDEILENCETLRYDGVCTSAVDVGDEPDPAASVLVAGVI